MIWALGVLAVLAVLLFCPVRIRIQYHGELRVHAGYLCFSKQLLPQPPQKPNEKKRRAAASPSEPPPRKRAEPSPKALLEMGLTLLKILPRPLMGFLKRITVDRIALRMNLVGEDAADAAQRAGKLNSHVYQLYALLGHLLTVRPPEVLILPDFLGQEDDIRGTARIRVRPYALLVLSVGVLIPFLKETLKKRGGRTEKPHTEPVPQAEQTI